MGDRFTARELETISGGKVRIPEPGLTVHLQFRRFAGCPICHLHLRSLARRHEELKAAGLQEVIVFHSSAEELRTYEGALPFAIVGDPQRRLYREYGVEAAPRALLNPRVFGGLVRALVNGFGDFFTGRHPAPPVLPAGGRLGLPADLLIGGDGEILAVKYGEHADDQWSVDELLALVQPAPARPQPVPGQ
ncbi:peroxiredoxin-like family protein [Myxococcus qinghaiensis]|uniref:peroxiredoxin-like family protein n=1 Tax=Myxococcus qinghaiensis TaxID=2906758 RepID=UPI0020A78065|nr:peroxiredoxin-like family protein [Myxococcus qinghaiensis]MCP3168281.1 AhpC/TSA family protein [Myxococcus qinghaiensis]